MRTVYFSQRDNLPVVSLQTITAHFLQCNTKEGVWVKFTPAMGAFEIRFENFFEPVIRGTRQSRVISLLRHSYFKM